MLFCPSCSNLLLVENEGGQDFFCQTCPYVYHITKPHTTRKLLQRKEVDDVLGGADAWKNVDSTEVSCPKCEHERAYFMQIQIRSADEPMSIFFKCCNENCQHQWREG
ncbi:putative DNA-directed RNA polymerases III 12.5 kDa polypeptide [Syncephalastrum racemosum]|uniref:DNA-directed RNA polymerase subunit n=1 Tax=Syncephalastrum racemosum TaxID=13706 RepID=A0A1X2HMV9_SYNRA|nr:putative DNA-directed RNA polymerases III 12.5 kDa polypeptide [Syncephalastrum racemosum]